MLNVDVVLHHAHHPFQNSPSKFGGDPGFAPTVFSHHKKALRSATDLMPFQITRRAYRVKDIVLATGLSKATVWRRIADGTLPSFKDGRSTLILAEDFEAYWRGRCGSR